ncbi:hypothetical protein BSKO_12228 [Bryopsis sp. KO-2023]|nr:hypothetical protein BSKO_12228 [Bryopsis sp. KO-2023]
MEDLLKRGSDLVGRQAGQGLLSAVDAEWAVQRLREFPVEEVGSSKWMDQRELIDKLNIQAHFNAQTHSDEFVVEHLVSHNRVGTLIHEILIMEIWREHLFPRLKSHLATSVDSVTSYYVIYHEVTLANLLEVCLFDNQVFRDLEDDYLLELCDWCHRKLAYLNSDVHKRNQAKEKDLKQLLKISGEEELERNCRDVDFATAISAVTILRYLCENITTLPMCVISRLLCSHDTVMALLALIENPPWVRIRKSKTEKFINNVWAPVEAFDRFKITQLDGQVWLSLNVLLVEPKCRAKYDMDDFRKERIIGLQRYFNEILFDQLPVLKDLERALDHLALGVASEGYDAKSAGLILEQVPMLREGMFKGKDWETIATNQKYATFGEEHEKSAKKRVEEMLKTIDFMCDMEQSPPMNSTEEPKENCTHGPIRVETRFQVKNTKVWERASDYKFEIDSEKVPEAIELAKDSDKVKGVRYRLKTSEMDSNKPFPANGKILVSHNGKSAEALMALPAPATKSAWKDAPPSVWLTVGLLAADGFALQLKLKKSNKNLERSKDEGLWHIYHPVGGAITVAQAL